MNRCPVHPDQLAGICTECRGFTSNVPLNLRPLTDYDAPRNTPTTAEERKRYRAETLAITRARMQSWRPDTSDDDEGDVTVNA